MNELIKIIYSVFLISWEIIFFIRRFINVIIIEWAIMYSACIIICLYVLRNKRMILRYTIQWFVIILNVIIFIDKTRILIIVLLSRWFSYLLVEWRVITVMERVMFSPRIKWIKRLSSSWRRLLRSRRYRVRCWGLRLTSRDWKRKILLWLFLLRW